MSDTISPALLQETIRAHDPDDRWKDFSELSARMTVRGALWELKGVPGLFEDVTLSGPIAEVRDTIAPFIYATPGFSTRENGTWEEDGHQWRRLEITYPEGFPTHSEVQQIYIDDAGLIARLDYSVDILGGGPAAHYSSGYQAFDGILVPTRRLVYVRRPDASPDRSSTSIDIIYSDIHFS